MPTRWCWSASGCGPLLKVESDLPEGQAFLEGRRPEGRREATGRRERSDRRVGAFLLGFELLTAVSYAQIKRVLRF